VVVHRDRVVQLGGKLNLREWNHVVAAFDGKARTLWINGRMASHSESVAPGAKAGKFLLGSVEPPQFPRHAR